MSDLGALSHEDPRTVWSREDRDFTPWLADNLDKLGAVLGMDLELVSRERAAGDFFIDILARDLGRDQFVVVENQLEQTDHSHLGQSITYAAAVNAGAVIWISREFREEHRAALDWLNRGLGATTEFYGVILEVLRIDGSKPAPYFRLVAAPAGRSIRRPSASVAPGRAPSEKGLRYQEFFQRLVDTLREKHQFTNARTAWTKNWFSFGSGTSGFFYSASFARAGRVRVELYIDRRDADENLATLAMFRQDAAVIERELGPLEWEELDSKRSCRVASYREGSIDDAQDNLDEYHDWMVEKLLAFKRVFTPRIQALPNVSASERIEEGP